MRVGLGGCPEPNVSCPHRVRELCLQHLQEEFPLHARISMNLLVIYYSETRLIYKFSRCRVRNTTGTWEHKTQQAELDKSSSELIIISPVPSFAWVSISGFLWQQLIPQFNYGFCSKLDHLSRVARNVIKCPLVAAGEKQSLSFHLLYTSLSQVRGFNLILYGTYSHRQDLNVKWLICKSSNLMKCF